MKKLVLAIAFIGMGSFAMAQQTTPQDREARRAEMQQKMQQKEQEHLAQMQKDLNLNASQVAQVKALHEKRKAEMKADFAKNKEVRQAKMEEMKAKRAQMDADMKKILTPEQYDKWQVDRKAKMEQKRMAMKERKMMKKPMNTAAPEVK
jgi:Spy/CpxP family protein refolding chaperone